MMAAVYIALCDHVNQDTTDEPQSSGEWLSLSRSLADKFMPDQISK